MLLVGQDGIANQAFLAHHKRMICKRPKILVFENVCHFKQSLYQELWEAEGYELYPIVTCGQDVGISTNIRRRLANVLLWV